MPRSNTPLALIALFALLVGGCGPEPAPSTVSPSSALPDGTPSATPTTSAAPSASPGEDLPAGGVRLEITGDVELEAELTTLIRAIMDPPPGAFALVWTGVGEDATTVGLGGSSFVGVAPTAATLVLTIAAPTPGGVSTWVSSAGECEVAMEVAEPTRFAGTFTCRDVPSDAGEVVDVSGAFEATG